MLERLDAIHPSDIAPLPMSDTNAFAEIDFDEEVKKVMDSAIHNMRDKKKSLVGKVQEWVAEVDRLCKVVVWELNMPPSLPSTTLLKHSQRAFFGIYEQVEL